MAKMVCESCLQTLLLSSLFFYGPICLPGPVFSLASIFSAKIHEIHGITGKYHVKTSLVLTKLNASNPLMYQNWDRFIFATIIYAFFNIFQVDGGFF